jgi:hypothetical protein
MCTIRCYKAVKDGLEKVEKYSWNPEKKVSKALLQKSGYNRFEIWVPEEMKVEMIAKGWKVGLRSDGTEIVSERGNVLLTYPERKPLPTFPY